MKTTAKRQVSSYAKSYYRFAQDTKDSTPTTASVQTIKTQQKKQRATNYPIGCITPTRTRGAVYELDRYAPT